MTVRAACWRQSAWIRRPNAVGQFSGTIRAVAEKMAAKMRTPQARPSTTSVWTSRRRRLRSSRAFWACGVSAARPGESAYRMVVGVYRVQRRRKLLRTWRDCAELVKTSAETAG